MKEYIVFRCTAEGLACIQLPRKVAARVSLQLRSPVLKETAESMALPESIRKVYRKRARMLEKHSLRYLFRKHPEKALLYCGYAFVPPFGGETRDGSPHLLESLFSSLVAVEVTKGGLKWPGVRDILDTLATTQVTFTQVREGDDG